jgi:hypothetical protein
MSKILIGIDFSMVKPAATVLKNDKYQFFIWPKQIDDVHAKLFLDHDVHVSKQTIIECQDIPKYDVMNADSLSDLIIDSLKPYLSKQTYIAFEGTSFASKGNATISLTAWRYILMYKLKGYLSLDQIFTYSPITIKSIAGCAKRGLGKKEMIDAFISESIESSFHQAISTTPARFKNKKETSWISCVDDIVDSYFTLKTLRIKEKI